MVVDSLCSWKLDVCVHAWNTTEVSENSIAQNKSVLLIIRKYWPDEKPELLSIRKQKKATVLKRTVSLPPAFIFSPSCHIPVCGSLGAACRIPTDGYCTVTWRHENSTVPLHISKKEIYGNFIHFVTRFNLLDVGDFAGYPQACKNAAGRCDCHGKHTFLLELGK